MSHLRVWIEAWCQGLCLWTPGQTKHSPLSLGVLEMMKCLMEFRNIQKYFHFHIIAAPTQGPFLKPNWSYQVSKELPHTLAFHLLKYLPPRPAPLIDWSRKLLGLKGPGEAASSLTPLLLCALLDLLEIAHPREKQFWLPFWPVQTTKGT